MSQGDTTRDSEPLIVETVLEATVHLVDEWDNYNNCVLELDAAIAGGHDITGEVARLYEARVVIIRRLMTN